jgi:nitrite reductase/ring-hydroxylating ferredoxin subunit
MMGSGSTDWVFAIEADLLPEGKAVRVDVDGTSVLVVRGEADAIYAVAARCTHQGAPLDRGVVKRNDTVPTVTCPAHGSVFSLVDGRVRRGPATVPVAAFEARVTDGKVELRLRP